MEVRALSTRLKYLLTIDNAYVPRLVPESSSENKEIITCLINTFNDEPTYRALCAVSSAMLMLDLKPFFNSRSLDTADKPRYVGVVEQMSIDPIVLAKAILIVK